MAAGSIRTFTPEALIAEAQSQYHKGRCEESIGLLLSAKRQDPQDRRIAITLAELLLDSERFADALRVLAELSEQEDDLELLALRGFCLSGAGDEQGCTRVADQLLAREAATEAAFTLKGIIAAHGGRLEEAEEFCRLAIAHQPEYGEPYKLLGLIEKERGNAQTALALLQQAFERSPLSRRIVLAYHTEVCAQEKYADARQVFLRAVARHPDNQRLRYLTIDILLRGRDYPRAMAEMETCLVRFGPDPGFLKAAMQARSHAQAFEVGAHSHSGPSISLCMIVRDEESHLARCLASVKPIVGEIVVVDTGSKDHTVEIAKVFGAKVFDFKWCGDFSAARNFGLSRATGAWILVLDADEIIAESDLARLLSEVENNPGRLSAYSIVTRNYTMQANLVGWTANDGRYKTEAAGNGWYPSEKVRLFPNDARIRFRYPIHELVEPAIKAVGFAIRRCPVPVHHYGKLDGTRNDEKAAAYYELGLKKLDELGDNLIAVREMAVQAAGLGKYAEAAHLWQQVLSLEPKSAEAWVNLGTACWNMRAYKRAAEYAERAVRLAPNFKEAHFNSALAHLYLGDAGKAIAVLETLLVSHPHYLSARFALACACACADLQEKARARFEEVGKSVTGIELGVALGEVVARLESAELARYADNVNRFKQRLECER